MASLAVATAAAMPFSASARNACRSFVMPLSVCASTWALLSTTLRAATESGLVTSVCTEFAKVSNTDDRALAELGSP
jgi:hypothetical protein